MKGQKASINQHILLTGTGTWETLLSDFSITSTCDIRTSGEVLKWNVDSCRCKACGLSCVSWRGARGLPFHRMTSYLCSTRRQLMSDSWLTVDVKLVAYPFTTRCQPRDLTFCHLTSTPLFNRTSLTKKWELHLTSSRLKLWSTLWKLCWARCQSMIMTSIYWSITKYILVYYLVLFMGRFQYAGDHTGIPSHCK